MKKEELENLFAGKLNGDVSNFSVWEQGTDVNLQLEYVDYIIKNEKKLKIDNIELAIDKLEDELTDTAAQKEIITGLSLKTDISAYRALEKFIEDKNHKLHEWAKIAYQYSRVMIEADLSDEPRIMIASGMGGRGNMLRYQAILSLKDDLKFTAFKQDVVRKELDFAAINTDAKIESCDFYDNFADIRFLLSFKKDVRDFMASVADNSNELGVGIASRIIISNTRAYDESDIRRLINADDLDDIDDFLDDNFPDTDAPDEHLL